MLRLDWVYKLNLYKYYLLLICQPHWKLTYLNSVCDNGKLCPHASVNAKGDIIPELAYYYMSI